MVKPFFKQKNKSFHPSHFLTFSMKYLSSIIKSEIFEKQFFFRFAYLILGM